MDQKLDQAHQSSPSALCFARFFMLHMEVVEVLCFLVLGLAVFTSQRQNINGQEISNDARCRQKAKRSGDDNEHMNHLEDPDAARALYHHQRAIFYGQLSSLTS